MACDICGKTGVPLHDLLDSYRTKEIAQICPDCESAINSKLSKLRHVTHNIMVHWLRRFMRESRASAKESGA